MLVSKLLHVRKVASGGHCSKVTVICSRTVCMIFTNSDLDFQGQEDKKMSKHVTKFSSKWLMLPCQNHGKITYVLIIHISAYLFTYLVTSRIRAVYI